jgi:hypothetical protein
MITVERFQDADRKWWVRETIKKGDLEVVMLYKCDTAGESMSLKNALERVYVQTVEVAVSAGNTST